MERAVEILADPTGSTSRKARFKSQPREYGAARRGEPASKEKGFRPHHLFGDRNGSRAGVVKCDEILCNVRALCDEKQHARFGKFTRIKDRTVTIFLPKFIHR